MTDRITLPPRELFASAEEYYATALHEIGTAASVLAETGRKAGDMKDVHDFGG
jgi:antirestriction protein ArdC